MGPLKYQKEKYCDITETGARSFSWSKSLTINKEDSINPYKKFYMYNWPKSVLIDLTCSQAHPWSFAYSHFCFLSNLFLWKLNVEYIMRCVYLYIINFCDTWFVTTRDVFFVWLYKFYFTIWKSFLLEYDIAKTVSVIKLKGLWSF